MKIMASAVLFERLPFDRTVRWRMVANELSMTLFVRRCFQCSAGKSYRRRPRVRALRPARAASGRAAIPARMGRSRAPRRRGRRAPSCLWRGADDDQQALGLVLQAGLHVDAVGSLGRAHRYNRSTFEEAPDHAHGIFLPKSLSGTLVWGRG